MATEIHETVKVMAVFDKGPRPVKFRWKDRVYRVKEITYTWRTREGSAPITHFTVTDGSTLFELSYNQESMKWALERVD